MAYDAAKAHEYYLKYRKKGLKKGRKKGKKKASVKKTNLVGLSTSGLNDEGRMEYALIKERITSDMNAELSKASTPEQKLEIRRKYQQQALNEVNNLKNNSKYAKAKANTSKSKSGSTKSGSSSKGSNDEAKQAADQKKKKKRKAAIKKLKTQISSMRDMISGLSPAKRQVAQDTLKNMLKRLKSLRG